jgi:NAD(P)H-flavin reductase
VSERRTLAPFGRRLATVSGVGGVGDYLLLRCSDPTGPAPRPGQFYMLASTYRWGGGTEERPFLPRAFSYLRHRREGRDGELEFLFEVVGPGTLRLAEMEVDDGLWLVGPLGRGFAAPRDGRSALLVGGGIGIVPLACWQDELRAAGAPAPALLGFRDAPYAQAAALMSDVSLATDDGSAGRRGLVTELLSERLDAGAAVEVYACGPPAMLEAVRAICARRDVPAQLVLESGMACGYGACFGCVVPTRDGYVRVCVDGPVLEARDLEGVPAH